MNALPTTSNNNIAFFEVNSKLDISYRIKLCKNIFDSCNSLLFHDMVDESIDDKRLYIIDQAIWYIYQDHILHFLQGQKITHEILIIAGDEKEKQIDNMLKILSRLNSVGTKRRSNPPVVIGGGVVIDVAGVAASLYRRGIPYVRVPTTLLSQIDGGVAAKTGINFEGYRNRIGSYFPPPLTIIDKTFIKTQSHRQIINGVGEIFKLALIKDSHLFSLLETYGSTVIDSKFQTDGIADEIINRSIKGMIDELEPNLWETNLKRCVDYGHTFSPLIEMSLIPELLHGEAVVLDCIISAGLSLSRSLISNCEFQKIIDVARQLSLPVRHHAFLDVDKLWEALNDTIKHRNGDQNIPLVNSIGSCTFINDLTKCELQKAVCLIRKIRS